MTIQYELENTDVRMPLMEGCPPLLLDSTNGHHNSTGTHSASLWLAFLTNTEQEGALECGFVALNNMRRCHAYLKILEASEIRMASLVPRPGPAFHCMFMETLGTRLADGSIFRTCSSSPYGIYNRGAPL